MSVPDRAGRRIGLLAVIGPGLLVAATGVGAGDLATSGFAGSRLGTAILWAVLLGAAVKYVLNEGLARYQLASGETLLAGAILRLGPAVTIGFVAYLLPWSFFTGAALINACGVTASSACFGDEPPPNARLLLGVAHSALGVAVAWLGGFRLFERVMAACVGLMFAAVVLTAVAIGPDWAAVARGLVVPAIPDLAGQGLPWTIALAGGVGGTLTILCYGYWLREAGRAGPAALGVCRADLAVAYATTALFGLAMIVIAGGLGTVEGRGTALVTGLADRLGETLGPAARFVFLIGAWAAVLTSLLGVWQAVPYVFADVWRMTRGGDATGGVSTRDAPYRAYLLALAVVPLVHVTRPFEQVQKLYAIVGAAFLPLLALALVVLNRRRGPAGDLGNRPLTSAVLLAIVGLFVAAGVLEVGRLLGP